MLGDDHAFVDSTPVDHGTSPPLSSRSFSSFRDAAEEAALSRLLAGIHFRTGNEMGFEQGTCIGNTILERVEFTRH